MRTIYKYPLPLESAALVQTYQGAQFLSFAEVNDDLFVWLSVDTEEPPVLRQFYVVGTGCEVPYDVVEFNATVQSRSGLVWHLFTGLEKPSRPARDALLDEITAEDAVLLERLRHS